MSANETGGQRWTKVRRGSLPDGILPKDADLLVDVGIPTMWFIEPDPLDHAEAHVIALGSRRLLRLGQTDVWAVFLDLGTGTVVGRAHERIDPSGDIAETFVNTDLRRFQEFCARAQAVLKVAHARPYESAGAAAGQPDGAAA